MLQRQKDNEGRLDLFEFPLESNIVLLLSDGSERLIIVNFHVTDEVTLKKYDISNLVTRSSKGEIKNIKRVSIDPEFKTLKEINSITIPIEMLLLQLQEGKTVIERIQEPCTLGTKHSNEVVDALKEVYFRITSGEYQLNPLLLLD